MGSISAIGGLGGWNAAGSPFSRLAPADPNATAQQGDKAAPNAGGAQATQTTLQASSGLQATTGTAQLSDEERRQVQQLQQRDREVRQHEQAHVSAGGSYVRGGAQLQYATGPDGKRYATGGEVQIDVGAESTPQATIAKMKTVERAAMAPAEPSGADRAVYTAAVKTEQAARKQLAEQNTQQTAGQGGAEQGGAAPAAQAQGAQALGQALPGTATAGVEQGLQPTAGVGGVRRAAQEGQAMASPLQAATSAQQTQGAFAQGAETARVFSRQAASTNVFVKRFAQQASATATPSTGGTRRLDIQV